MRRRLSSEDASAALKQSPARFAHFCRAHHYDRFLTLQAMEWYSSGSRPKGDRELSTVVTVRGPVPPCCQMPSFCREDAIVGEDLRMLQPYKMESADNDCFAASSSQPTGP
jgi:hypothetical protein